MTNMVQTVFHAAQENAPAITYTGGGSAFVLWGLHLSDIGVLISMAATLAGVFLQVYVTMHKMRMLERDQKEAQRLALIATGQGIVAAAKSADNSARVTAVEAKVDSLTKPPATP